MTLDSAVEWLSPASQPAVSLAAQACLHSKNKYADCEACYTLCPTQAIHPGKPPSFDAQACVTCMACLPACPVGAFSGEDRVKDLLSAAARAVERHKIKQIDLLCHFHNNPAAGPTGSELGLRVQGCLSQLGAGAYLGLLALGLEKITVRLEDCSQCAWAPLKERIADQVEQSRAISSPWFNASQIGLLEQADESNLYARPGWNADSPPISRAELLRPGGVPVEPKYELLIAPGEDLSSQQGLGLDRARQATALRYFNGVIQPVDRSGATPVNFTRVHVDDRCNGCGICAQACPTGAIDRTVVEDREYRLTFHPLNCVDCQVCAAMCPEEAIRLESPVPVNDLLVGEQLLHSGRLIHCLSCNALFGPKSGETLCPTCQFRRDNPLGSRMPFKK